MRIRMHFLSSELLETMPLNCCAKPEQLKVSLTLQKNKQVFLLKEPCNQSHRRCHFIDVQSSKLI